MLGCCRWKNAAGWGGCVTSKTSGAFNLLNVFKLSATESHFAVTWQNKALFEVADPWLMQCPTSPVCVNHEERRRDQTNLAGWQTVSGAQSRFLRTTGHPPSAGCHLRKERHRRRDVKDSNVYTQKTHILTYVALQTTPDIKLQDKGVQKAWRTVPKWYLIVVWHHPAAPGEVGVGKCCPEFTSGNSDLPHWQERSVIIAL